MRFVAVQEPPHDSWAVFDAGNDAPAEYAGRVLIGLTLHEARRFAAVANDHCGWSQRLWPVRLELVNPAADGVPAAREKDNRTNS
ncbi:hypothetical protein AB6802_07660 [Mesorhizobium sp. RCC_202]|uniref:hypothetical protein n=1 Tax=Mesorhizobium sp. RCC_202 TaxID=3239222 RepID=UPI0035231941